MKRHEFTYPGGFPLTQDRLKYMQDGWEGGFAAFAEVFGSANLLKGVILEGMDYSIVGDDVTITAGWFAAKESGQPARLYRVDTQTFASPVATRIPILQLGEVQSPLTFNDGSTPNAIRERKGVSTSVTIGHTPTPGLQIHYHDMVCMPPKWEALDAYLDGGVDVEDSPRINIDVWGRVNLNGSVKSNLGGASGIAALPVKYRPDETKYFTCAVEDSLAQFRIVVVAVYTTGDITVMTPETLATDDIIHLDSINYLIA